MIKINNDWDRILESQFESEYFKALDNFINEDSKEHNIFPKEENRFNFLKLTPYNEVKVVIMGQDPYHEVGQAHGLAFSVLENTKLPPSLVNIYKELKDDLGIEISKSGNLTSWAKQGVLLLNSVLTVREHFANSHKNKGWEEFTDYIIKVLNERSEPIIFVLWGNFAIKKSKLITNNHHYILTSAHPSPLSAYQGFFGCKHFSKINEILKVNNKSSIDWRIEDTIDE